MHRHTDRMQGITPIREFKMDLSTASTMHKCFLANPMDFAASVGLSPPPSLVPPSVTTTTSSPKEVVEYQTGDAQILVLQIAANHGLTGVQKETFELLASKLLYADNQSSTYTPCDAFPPKDRIEIIIGGAGGTGKSYVIAAVDSLALALNKRHLVLKASEFGSTASNIQGYTIKSLVHTRRTKGKFDRAIYECVLLIIDEYGLCNLKNLQS